MSGKAFEAEVVLSFDNLGEAADEELGLSVDPPPHFSVVEILPKVLGLLEEADLHATFFVEAINVGRYPKALAAILDGGHELGCHAWRHESWHSLDVPARHDVLRRSLNALRSVGGEVVGFRPPGGIVGDTDFPMLAGEGIEWVSPAGSRAGVRDNVVCLPFAWRDIDAYYFAPALAPLRRDDGRSSGPLDPAEFARAGRDAINASRDAGGPDAPSLVLHPYLYTTNERLAVLADLVDQLGHLKASGEVRVGPGRQAAERLMQSPELPTPALDSSTWS